jgi:RimJ/RimL family protein N-acetyltransferase
MEVLMSERLILRRFNQNDWKDFLELSVDWNNSPGPEWDKWGVTEKECKESVNYMSTDEKYYAVYLRNEQKVIGLIALNGINEFGQDVGHVIHTKYQNNDIDKEALYLIINYIFEKTKIEKIITGNFPNEKQIAPLISLGFVKHDEDQDGVLRIDKERWEKINKISLVSKIGTGSTIRTPAEPMEPSVI